MATPKKKVYLNTPDLWFVNSKTLLLYGLLVSVYFTVLINPVKRRTIRQQMGVTVPSVRQHVKLESSAQATQHNKHPVGCSYAAALSQEQPSIIHDGLFPISYCIYTTSIYWRKIHHNQPQLLRLMGQVIHLQAKTQIYRLLLLLYICTAVLIIIVDFLAFMGEDYLAKLIIQSMWALWN